MQYMQAAIARMNIASRLMTILENMVTFIFVRKKILIKK